MSIVSDLGWTKRDGEPDRCFVVDSSCWSRPASISSLPSCASLAITVASLIEIMTPPDEPEFQRRKQCASLVGTRASILLPNASYYRYFLCGKRSLDELREHTADFQKAFELFLRCPDYSSWSTTHSQLFEWLRSERNSGYLSFAKALQTAAHDTYRSVFEIAEENGLPLDPNSRQDRGVVIRTLTRRLYDENWQPYLLPELLPRFKDSAYHYLRLYTRLIGTNLPGLADASGLDVTGNDMGDMEDAYFIGQHIDEIGGRFGIAVLVERKWERLTRELDRGGKSFPMGTPAWVAGLGLPGATFDVPIS